MLVIRDPAICAAVKRLALTEAISVSQILKEAVEEYDQRHPKEKRPYEST